MSLSEKVEERKKQAREPWLGAQRCSRVCKIKVEPVCEAVFLERRLVRRGNAPQISVTLWCIHCSAIPLQSLVQGQEGKWQGVDGGWGELLHYTLHYWSSADLAFCDLWPLGICAHDTLPLHQIHHRRHWHFVKYTQFCCPEKQLILFSILATTRWKPA